MLSRIFGLVVLILDICAIIQILGSAVETGSKVLRIVLMILLLILGFLIWLCAGSEDGPRPASTAVFSSSEVYPLVGNLARRPVGEQPNRLAAVRADRGKRDQRARKGAEAEIGADAHGIP